MGVSEKIRSDRHFNHIHYKVDHSNKVFYQNFKQETYFLHIIVLLLYLKYI